MPLYEFRCLKCRELFELLIMKQDEQIEMKCPNCDASEFERVLSTTSYCVNGGSNQNAGAKVETRNCSGGSCTTYDIAGPNG